MRDFPDVKGAVSAGSDHLGMTFQAKIGIVLREHFRIGGTMGSVADHAAFAERLVLVNERPGLLAMTLGAGFIQARHGQSAFRLEDVASVRVVALDAIHFIFEHWMMMGKFEFSLLLNVTLKTGGGFPAGIDDEFAATAPALNMAAAGSVAGFATGSAREFFLIKMDAGMDAAGKGGAIKRLTEKMDPRGYVVWPISAPSGDDKDRHYLYRFWRRLPEQGQISIFDRSWYGRVLVERLEGFCTEEAWQRAYGEINQFERQLTDFGTVVLKFWLNI